MGSAIQRISLGYTTYGMMIWCGIGGYIITPTIKATSALNLDERMITKKLLGCTRSWSELDFKIKEREISSTSAAMATGRSII
jgi:hypothetical protein